MSNQSLTPVADAIIVRQESLATIVQAGPQSYQSNALSCRRCTEAGRQLLDLVEKEGMNDELDRLIAVHIEKARKTLKVMNERRAPVTKLFDQVRAEFTVLENNINPAQKGTIPYRLQQLRNAYAAKKREEEERRLQAELAARELARAKESYRLSIEEDFRGAFNRYLNTAINELTNLNASVTLANYQAVSDIITGYASQLPADWKPVPTVRQPFNLSPDEGKEIRAAAWKELQPKFAQQFTFEIDDYRRELLDKLPSKRAELERIAAAEAEEAERIKAEMARREVEDAARKESERRRVEEEARQKAELHKANAEIGGLFKMAQAEQTYTPKTKVTKKIVITDPAAFLSVVSTWWQREGCRMSIDELAKIFKKQVTFCEKIANKEGVFVESAGLEYVDDVKAQ